MNILTFEKHSVTSSSSRWITWLKSVHEVFKIQTRCGWTRLCLPWLAQPHWHHDQRVQLRPADALPWQQHSISGWWRGSASTTSGWRRSEVSDARLSSSSLQHSAALSKPAAGTYVSAGQHGDWNNVELLQSYSLSDIDNSSDVDINPIPYFNQQGSWISELSVTKCHKPQFPFLLWYWTNPFITLFDGLAFQLIPQNC